MKMSIPSRSLLLIDQTALPDDSPQGQLGVFILNSFFERSDLVCINRSDREKFWRPEG